MTYFAVAYKLFSFLVIALSLWIGLWVFSANRKSKTNLLFLWMAVMVSLWIGFYYLTVTTTSSQFALFWSKLAYGAVSIFYIPFYLFFISFLKLEKKFRHLSKIIIFGGISLSLFSLFTNRVVKEAVFENGRIDLVFSKGSLIFYGMAIFLSVFVLGAIFKRYFTVSHFEKLQMQYFLTGAFLWIFMNLIFNTVFTVWQSSVQYASIGNYSAIFLLGFTAYAIVKQELFGIKVVVTTIFVGLTAISLALDALIFTSDLVLQLFKGLILIIFLYLGYALIRSVTREIKQRREIEKLSKAKSEFISIASHQLRTPLTAIKGYISMILEGTYGETSPKVKEPMKKVYISNERLINLVNNLLSISRIESGKMGIDFEKVSIEGLISSIIDMFGIEAEKKNIFLKFEKPKKPLPEISIDKEKITDVISNIISNCIKYTEKGGITVRVKKLSHRSKPGEKRILPKLRIIVSDTGEGMTKEELSKVFQSFSRGMAGTKLYTEGAGLGLYVARKYIEMHKGKIWAESAGKDKGSTFYIELPMK